MLILTRRIGETLVIGDNVTMTVLGIKGGQVRLGINAPMTVSIHREEIYEKIKQEQENNSNSDEGGEGAILTNKIPNSYHKPTDQEYKESMESFVGHKEDRKWHKNKPSIKHNNSKGYRAKSFEDQKHFKSFDSHKGSIGHHTNYVKRANHLNGPHNSKLPDLSLRKSEDEDAIGNV